MPQYVRPWINRTKLEREDKDIIYLIEGPDGVGKTTLAQEIDRQRKVSIIHATYKPAWDIKEHHKDIWKAAKLIHKWTDVVIDRWAPSDLIYGTVFRGEPYYDVNGYLWEMEPEFEKEGVTWIYCRNDNAVKNHLKLKQEREEMYDDISGVVKGSDSSQQTKHLSS